MSEGRKIVLSRRDFLRGASALAVGSVLAACAPTPAPPATEAPKEEVKPTEAPEEAPAEKAVQETPVAEPAEKVTITYWFAWGADYAKAIEALQETEKYKEMLPDVKVETLPGADMEKLLTAIAGGEPPDGGSNYSYHALFARGAVQKLTEWINSSNVLVKENFWDEIWKSASWEGDLYAVPAAEGCFGNNLYYNTKMAEAADLDPKNPPQTWSEVFEWHKKLTKFDEAGNARVIGLDPYDARGGSVGYGDPFIVPHMWGFDYFDEVQKTYNLDNPDMVESFQVEGEFYKFIGPDKMSAFRQSFGTWGPSFNSEVQATIIEGYWHPGETFHQAPEVVEHMGVTWMPVPDKRKGIKVQSIGAQYIVIPVGAKHPQQMFRFTEFINTDVAYDILFKMVGWLPQNKTYLSKVDASIYPTLPWVLESMLKADEVHGVEPDPITDFTAKTWTDLREMEYRGDITPEEAARQFQEKCTAEIQKV